MSSLNLKMSCVICRECQEKEDSSLNVKRKKFLMEVKTSKTDHDAHDIFKILKTNGIKANVYLIDGGR